MAVDSTIKLNDIIAAILGDQQSLTDEELKAFEDLFNDPSLDPAKREEFFQTLWAIVVSIIDCRWESPSNPVEKNICVKHDPSLNDCAPNMLDFEDSELSKIYENAVNRSQQKGAFYDSQ